jgi:murein DD-endopeptidase MepM/ murein hydrolase activator NlpD
VPRYGPPVARQIDTYLRGKKSPLAGYGTQFVAAAEANGLDPYLLVAISGAESEFGKKIKPGTNNPFGWGPHIPFGSFTEAIDTVSRGLKRGYIDEGLTSIPSIGAKWAPRGVANDPTDLNANWSWNVTKLYREASGGKSPKAAAPRSGFAAEPLAPAATLGAPAPQAAGISPMVASILDRNAQLLGVPSIAPMLTKPAAPVIPDLAASVPSLGTSSRPSAPAPQGTFGAPLATPMGGSSEFGMSDPEGAPSKNGGRFHAAKDWFGPAGSAVSSPWAGTVVEVKPSRGNSGQVFGGVVKIRGADGRVFVARHVDPRGVKVGQKIGANAPIATVSPWTGGSPHAHIEIWKTLGGGYRYENMLDPVAVLGGR